MDVYITALYRALASSRTRLLEHTQSDAPRSVGLLWTNDHSVAETSTWQHTTLTRNIHGASAIRTHNISRRAAVDLRLRPSGCWDRPSFSLQCYMFIIFYIIHCRITYTATFTTIWSQHTTVLNVAILTIRNFSYHNCKLPEDGVLTPKHVVVILILICTLLICAYVGIYLFPGP
jgi:hypothetical protein